MPERRARPRVAAATRYYKAQRSELGREFYAAVKETLAAHAETAESAAHHPEAPRELGLRRLRLARFPYVIVFYSRDTENVIVAVSHLRREPLYWLPRAHRR